jgi:hypothetical protein
MNTKTAGLLSTLFGAGLVAGTWYFALYKGDYYWPPCLLGSALFVSGIAMLVLPPEKLFRQVEHDGDGTKIVSYDRNKLSPLGWVLVSIGLAIGGIQVVLHEAGWF